MNNSYLNSITLKRPQTLFKESEIDNIFYTLKKDYNLSNSYLTQKRSFKKKVLSIFKSHSKLSQQSSPNEIPSYVIDDHQSVKHLPIREKFSRLERSQSYAVNSSIRRSNNKSKRNEGKENYIKRLDSGDLTLIDKYYVHPLNGEILKFITEFYCLPIKLPNSWINKLETHLSNNLIMPFISKIPGLLGIENHGNTCYLNVIIQCLAHIDSVAEYFSTKDYLQHVKFNENVSSTMEHNGSVINIASGFDVMVGFSYLLQSLWQMTYQSKISMKFCKLLTLHKREFSLDSQQDAHELLLYILNLLHENLMPTTMINNEYSFTNSRLIDGNSTNDSETSFIYERFRGWLSNEIVCPDCQYTRKTLDQILSLNLQIPKQPLTTSSISSQTIDSSIFFINVINPNQTCEKHAIEITKFTTINDIRICLAERIGCTKFDIVIIEIIESGFGNLFSDTEKVMEICKKNNRYGKESFDCFSDGIYAICIPNQVIDVDSLQVDTSSNDNDFSSRNQKQLPQHQSFIRLLVIHVEKTKDCFAEVSEELQQMIYNAEMQNLSSDNNYDRSCFVSDTNCIRFTNVLSVQAARQTKFSLLRHSLSEQMFKYFNLRNVTKFPKPRFIISGFYPISEKDLLPLTLDAVNKDLKYTMEHCGESSAHVRLVVVWPAGTRNKMRLYRRHIRDGLYDSRPLILNLNKLSNHSSVEKMKSKLEKEALELEFGQNSLQNKIHITDCLREFFSLDTLSTTESWKCPNCQSSQPPRTEIRIEQAPEILILMLKRFSKQNCKYSNNLLDKRDTSDMLCNLRNQNSDDYKMKSEVFPRSDNTELAGESLNKLDCRVNYPLKDLDLRMFMENGSEDTNYLYDLEGVVNHRGSLFNGHYVAICHNSVDDKWRLYDDDRVTEVPVSDVVQPDAYILFYKRQKQESKSSLHWSYRRLAFPEKVHRNSSLSSNSIYLNRSRYSEHVEKTLNSNSSIPLSVTNNHSSRCSLLSRISPDSVDRIISSPIVPSDSLLISTDLDNNLEYENSELSNRIIDLSKIRSKIIDVDLLSLNSLLIDDVSQMNTTSSNDSCTKSLNDDSGTVLSQDFTCPVQKKKHHHLPVDDNSKDECYNSFSTSPSTSSPNTSNAY